MSKPTSAILPIENGKLITNLDCNNLQLINLDESNLSGGGGGGGGGNDTGTTTAILKGDGNHGFADAQPNVDYATPTSLTGKEDITTHDADIALVNADIAAANAAIALKANSADVTTALALKADQSALTAYISSNDAAVALKANSADVTTALALKADVTALTSGLALKEPLLPTTLNDAWILARRNISGGNQWFFVDPVTLGTTNQSFVDGQSFTNTNFDSASAQFNSGDVGKTITGTNIPAATTISSITSATRVVLSQATTGTGSSLSFTIFNRLTVAGGGGTVTSVSVNVSPVMQGLFTGSVSNATTSATINLTEALAASNTFYGNPFVIPAGGQYMSAATARTALGGTTVGQAMFQLANPSAISYPQIQANNSVLARTPAQTLTDLGAEKALTFNFPLARGGVNLDTISIPAATDTIAGHLTAADHVAFNAKVPPTRTITATAPITVTPGGPVATLANNLTLAMPASASNIDGTGQVDGYMRGADFFNFVTKPPSTRVIGTTAPLTGGGDLGQNRTIAIPKSTAAVDGYLAAADFNLFAAGAGASGTTVSLGASSAFTVPVQTPPVTRVILNTAISGGVLITLPPAANYGSALNYPFIEIVDIVPGGAMQAPGSGITLLPSASNTIDGQASYSMAKSMGYLRLNSNGGATNTGRWIPAKYFVDSFRNPADATSQVRVDISSVPTGTTRVLRPAPAADSVTIVPNTGSSGDGTFIYDYDANGQALRSLPSNILPDPSGHEGQVLTVVTGIPAWSGGSGASPFVSLTDAATITWNCIANQRAQNAYVSLNGDRTLNIVGAQSGMEFTLFVIQGLGNNHLILPVGSLTPTNGLGLINPPLSTAIGSCDLIKGYWVGTSRIPSSWVVEGLNLTGVGPSMCNVAGATGAATGASVIANNGTSKSWVAMNFDAAGTAICGIAVNLLQVGLPNYAIQASIYTDGSRTITTAATTSGSSLVTTPTALWTTADSGMRITGAAGGALPGFPAGTYYAQFVTTSSINISSDKAGTTLVNANATLSGQTVNMFGVPGTLVGSPGWSTNAISSTSVPIYATAAAATAAGHTGDPNADQNPTSFTGVTATSMTNAATYWVVVQFQGTPDTSNHVDLLANVSTAANGYNIKWSANGISWTTANVGHKARFTTYHT